MKAIASIGSYGTLDVVGFQCQSITSHPVSSIQHLLGESDVFRQLDLVRWQEIMRC